MLSNDEYVIITKKELLLIYSILKGQFKNLTGRGIRELDKMGIIPLLEEIETKLNLGE